MKTARCTWILAIGLSGIFAACADAEAQVYHAQYQPYVSSAMPVAPRLASGWDAASNEVRPISDEAPVADAAPVSGSAARARPVAVGANAANAAGTMVPAVASANAGASSAQSVPPGAIVPFAAPMTAPMMVPPRAGLTHEQPYGPLSQPDTCHARCDTGSCDAYGQPGICCVPLWSAEIGTRVLARNHPRDAPIVEEATVANNFAPVQPISSLTGLPVPLRVPISGASPSFDIAAGLDVTISRYLGRDSENRDQFFDFHYWGLNHYDSSVVAEGSRLTDETQPVQYGSLFTPFTYVIGGFNRADFATFDYSSEIHSFEWNLRFCPRGRNDRLVLKPDGCWRREAQAGCYWTYLVGLRYLSLDEDAQLYTRGVYSGTAVSDTASFGGQYNTTANNDMLGIQAGLDATWRQPRYSMGIGSKVAPFIDFSEMTAMIRSEDPVFVNTINKDLKATANRAAFLGELSFHGTYLIKQNFSVSASYDFIWLTGVALATEQYNFETDPLAKVNANGHTLYHGLTLTAQLSW